MPKYRLYVKATGEGKAIVEAEDQEKALQYACENIDQLDIDWDDDYRDEVEIDGDNEIVQVCDKCEGNPDDGLTDGLCGACRHGQEAAERPSGGSVRRPDRGGSDARLLGGDVEVF